MCELNNNSLSPRRGLLAGALAAALLGLGAIRASADVGILTTTDASQVPAHTTSVELALDRVGLDHRRVDLALISERTLRPFEVIVVPSLRLSAPATEALRRFKDRGGRWVVYQSEGPAALDALLGIRPLTSSPLSTPPRALVPEPRLAMPARVLIAAGTAPRSVEAADPSFSAARWDTAYGPAALVRGPYGYFVNMAPGSSEPHSDLLLAVLGDLEPNIWEEAQAGSRRAAEAAVRHAADRWADLRRKVEFTAAQRSKIDSRLRNRRAEIPPLGGLSAEVDAERSLLAERIKTALRVRDEVVRLTYEMMPARKGEVRGLWITPSARLDWDAMMRRARDAGLNTVFVQVGSGGSAIYPSEVLPTVDWARNGTDEVALAVESAKRAGLAFHACRSSYDLTGVPKDALSRLITEDRLLAPVTARSTPSLNPGDPRNNDLELAAVLELVRKYDLDGVHLTQASYPEAVADAGAVSRREFEKLRGAVERWPDDVIGGARKLQFEDWQRDNVNRLIQRVGEEVKKVKPYVQVSASIIPDRGRARAGQRQDWAVWARDGWVDFLVPRNHTPALEAVTTAVEEQVSAIRGRVPVVAGLTSFAAQPAVALLSQVEAAREQGADGFVLGDLGTDNLDEQLLALRAGATAEGTWPSYLAPKAAWALDPVVERADMPWSMLLGDRLNIEVKLLNVSPSRQQLKNATGEARLEDTDGRLLQSLGAVTGFGPRKFKFAAPAGRFRPVLRGNMVLADGTSRPFVLRGPLCDGVSPDELAALRAQDAPPNVTGAGRKVAIYAGSRGADQLGPIFADGLNVNVFPLYRLLPDHLAKAEVLVLASLSDVAELSAATIQSLRQWVTNGGTLFLFHEAVGVSWHPRMFPEVAVGMDYGVVESLEVVPMVGAIKPGTIIPVGPSEVIWLKPAAGAEVLLREAGEKGTPVAVTAAVGKGRVVMYGAGLSAAGRRILGPEQEFLWGLLGPR